MRLVRNPAPHADRQAGPSHAQGPEAPPSDNRAIRQALGAEAEEQDATATWPPLPRLQPTRAGVGETQRGITFMKQIGIRKPGEVLVPTPAEQTAPADFTVLANSVVRTLRKLTDLDAWMVARVVDREQVLLAADADGLPVAPGFHQAWEDSVCGLLLGGGATLPLVVDDLTTLPGYQHSIADRLKIGFYAGAPMYDRAGNLIGTLCGLDRTPHAVAMPALADLVAVQAAMLAKLLDAELLNAKHQRQVNGELIGVHRDAPTGLPDRVAWGGLLAEQEDVVRRYGTPAGVIVIGIDAVVTAGALRRITKALRDEGRRTNDAIAVRLDGRHFALLTLDRTRREVSGTATRLERKLNDLKVHPRVGWAMRGEAEDLQETWRLADKRKFERHRDSMHVGG
jgi:diguanylate cyclase